MSAPAGAYRDRARHGGGRARCRFLLFAAATALPISAVSLPAAATSAVTVEAFAELCLERALSGRPVKPAVLARGMEITGEITAEDFDEDTVKRNSITWAGIPLTIVTGTGFGADQGRASMPEGIVVLGVGMSSVLAKDPAGRRVDIVTCGVTSTEQPTAARALGDVQRQLSDKLPREAVASAPSTRVRDGLTMDHIHWTWGDMDSDTGRFRVDYGGRAAPDFMGGAILVAYRLKRAPE